MSEQFSCFFPDHEYPGYQTNYDHTYQDLAAYNTGYDTNSLTSAYTSVTEKQDELDMDVSNQLKSLTSEATLLATQFF